MEPQGACPAGACPAGARPGVRIGLPNAATRRGKTAMKYGARNNVKAKVTSVQKGDIISLVKFEVAVPARMASVLTTESVQELGLNVGDEVQLVIKAIHVLPVRE